MSRLFSQPPSLLDVVIVLLVVFVLAWLAMPDTGRGGIVRAQPVQTLTNMRQLHAATLAMAADGIKTGHSDLGWPGDTDKTFATWASNLVAGGYLKTNDFFKLLSAPGRPAPSDIPTLNTNALLLYAVGAHSPANTVFLTTANFTNTPTGGAAPLPKSRPYSDEVFVVFRQGGDGAVLKPAQGGKTNVIGSYVPLCK